MLATPRDARRASGSPAPSSATPSTSSAAAPTTTSRSVHASELRPLGEWTWGELRARAGARRRRRCARAASERATASPPTCRTSPRRSPPSSAARRIGAIWSSCAPEFGVRSVVDRFAQIEPKVLLAVDGYRYGGKDFDRSDDDRGAAAGAADARAHVRAARTSARRRTGTSCPPARARVRAAPVRPPALGALHLRHDRPAEGDRARPGRDPARAPEEAPPPPRRARRRPALLVHDDRLDDVELPRRRPAHARRRSSSTTATRRTRTSERCGISPTRPGITCFGTSAAYIAALP